jgi:hypothetical protein
VNFDPIKAEQEAYRGMTELLERVQDVQQLFERAGLALPERFQRLLEAPANGAKERAVTRGASRVPPLVYPAPVEATGEWISIDMKEAQATCVALAVLRAEGAPIRPKDLNTRVASILPDVTSGTLANAGTRLADDNIIDRTDDGWSLLKKEGAGVIHEGRIWGPPKIFGKQEIAAHRREAVLHVLANFPTGLQIVQIVEQLKGCSWVHAPVNKDLLKGDMNILLDEKHKVKRVGHSRKFTLAHGEKTE